MVEQKVVVSNIWRYPIKGLAGESLTTTILSSGRGIVYDRRWLLATADTAPLLNGNDKWRPWNYGLTLKKAYDILKKISGNAKPPTVYRALNFLQTAGLAHKLNSQKTYVGCSHPLTKPHCCHFLICTKCGQYASGVRLHEQSPALSVVDMGNNIEVKTAAGMVCCRQVVFAGNAYLEIAPRLRTRVMPASTCIGATAPLGAAAAENLIANQRAVCDMNFVIDYFRCSADTRLLFGGRVDYANRTPSDLAGCIRQRMEKVFPQLIGEKLDYVWGGAVAITFSVHRQRFGNIFIFI